MAGRTPGGHGGRGWQAGARGSGARGANARKPQPQGATNNKFKGNCAELNGCVFDCSDYKQADNFVTTLKRISEHIGATYKHGGDIRSSIINEIKVMLTVPTGLG